MKAENVRKILIFDQGDPVAAQLLGKAAEVFGVGADTGDGPEYVMLRARRTHNLALEMLDKTIREEKPELHLPERYCRVTDQGRHRNREKLRKSPGMV